MEQSAVTALFLPLALGIIMLGMGMTLTLDDFRRIVKDPRAVLVGLGAQLVILPLFGLLLAVGFELRPSWPWASCCWPWSRWGNIQPDIASCQGRFSAIGNAHRHKQHRDQLHPAYFPRHGVGALDAGR